MATAAVANLVEGFVFNPETHLYSHPQFRRILSCTQVLSNVGFIDYDGVKQSVLEWKSSLGSAVHAATHYLDEDDLNWETLDEAGIPYVLAYERFKKDCSFVPRLIEFNACVKVNGMPLGFQCDREGMLGQWPAIVELKTCSKEEASWKLQLAGYDLGLRAAGYKPSGQPYWKRVGVMLKPDGNYKLYGPYDNPRDRDIFLASLAIAYEKINLGIGVE